MQNDYRNTHLAEGKGDSYAEAFSNNAYRKMVWEFEQSSLREIFSRMYRGRAVNHLDFACGTGRILSLFHPVVAQSTGVDVSESMLSVAKQAVPAATIVQADITRDPALCAEKFELVTAFRFFPNAQCELRKEAIAAIANRLDKDGYLIFNNHKNTEGTRNRLARLFGRRGFQGMSHAEVLALIHGADLEIVESHGLCIFPASENRTILPVRLLKVLESAFMKLPFLRYFGENIIYVCRQKRSA